MFRKSKTGAVIGVAVASAAQLQAFRWRCWWSPPGAGSPLSTHRALKPPSAGKRASSAKNILAPVRRVAAFSAILRHKSIAPDWVRPWVNVSWTVSAQIPSGAGSSDNHSGSAPTRSGAAHTGGPPSSSSWTSRCPLATAIPAPPPSIRPVAPRPTRVAMSDWAGPRESRGRSGPPPRR